jgi:hypothetical protein
VPGATDLAARRLPSMARGAVAGLVFRAVGQGMPGASVVGHVRFARGRRARRWHCFVGSSGTGMFYVGRRRGTEWPRFRRTRMYAYAIPA